ncbi:tape measure protein [Vagococcus fluvialis]|uniref:tape measure protein n=1 Tax=Vagococcus fluvialis TaxID=2738 RepID=UPI001D0A59D3|nr:tape measure protein [Vagococcus fluvialis]UDM74062.1 tape measure protein [Vagococcus fluvialis]
MAESYTVEAILSAVDKGFTDAMKSADKSMGGLDKNTQKTNMSVMDMAKGAGVFKIVDAAIGMVSSSVDGAISRFDTLNKYPTVMEALGYSTKDVDKSMKQLTEGIDGLPTTLDSIVDSAQRLAISSGSLDKGTDYALAFNNAMLSSGASTATAEGALTQFSQALGKGKLQGDEFNSVASASPILISKMAESFGFGAEGSSQLKDALSSGSITATEFADRMVELNDGVGGFAELAQKNSKGIETSFQNMKGAVTKGVENVIRAVDDGLKQANFGGIADIMDKIKNNINKGFENFNQHVPAMIDNAIKFYNAVQPFLPLISGLMGAFALVGVVNSIKKSLEGLGETINILTKHPYLAIIGAVIGAIVYLWTTNENFRNAVLNIWSNIQAGITVAMDAISNIINTVTGFFKGIWEKYHKEIELITSIVWTAIKTRIELTINAIKTVISIVLEIIKGIWKNTWHTIKTVAETVWNAIKITIETVMGIIKGVIKTVTSLIKGDWQGVWDGMSQIVDSAWSGITGLIENGLKGAVDLITGWGKNFFDAGANIVNMIGDGIMSAVDTVKGAIGNVTESIRNYLPFSPAKEGPLRDLHRLNFGGTISTGIYAGKKQIDKAMNSVLNIPAFSTDVDIMSNVSDLNSRLSNANMSLSSNNELTLNESKRPMQLNLNIGGQNFRGFVNNLSEAMNSDIVLELQN